MHHLLKVPAVEAKIKQQLEELEKMVSDAEKRGIHFNFTFLNPFLIFLQETETFPTSSITFGLQWSSSSSSASLGVSSDTLTLKGKFRINSLTRALDWFDFRTHRRRLNEYNTNRQRLREERQTKVWLVNWGISKLG